MLEYLVHLSSPLCALFKLAEVCAKAQGAVYTFLSAYFPGGRPLKSVTIIVPYEDGNLRYLTLWRYVYLSQCPNFINMMSDTFRVT
jgi:hypothetical protein